MIKILMIHNPKKANPYGLRRFVKKLRFILIEKRGYDFAWGCPLEVDDPRYPVVGVDKRFIMHRELTFADEDGRNSQSYCFALSGNVGGRRDDFNACS